jgi:hypothetical protein
LDEGPRGDGRPPVEQQAAVRRVLQEACLALDQQADPSGFAVTTADQPETPFVRTPLILGIENPDGQNEEEQPVQHSDHDATTRETKNAASAQRMKKLPEPA